MKKKIKWLIYIAPFIMAAIELIIYYIVIPNVYGKIIPLKDWLFEDISNFSKALIGTDVKTSQMQGIVLFKILLSVFFGLFSVSLFFVGREFHNKRPAVNTNAKFKGKDVYLLVLDALAHIKELEHKSSKKDVRDLSHRIKILEEKLMTAGDFGRGGEDVTKCEDEIGEKLHSINNELICLNIKYSNEKAQTIASLVISVNELLKKRIVLMTK